MTDVKTIIESEADVNNATATRTVPVALGERSYDILIGPGLISNAGTLISQHLNTGRCAIVTDENVAGCHLPALQAGLDAGGVTSFNLVVPPGEASKCFRELEDLCDRLLEGGLERGDIVVALGGGVVGDLAGFAAAVVRRGVRFVQVPTSLLAQVDSSVGGKTGINTARGKNLVGAFHQPGLVLIDTDTLETLPERQLRAGYAEMVKYGLLGDLEFFTWLETHWQSIFAGDADARISAIETSCRAKAAIVARDERETGDRALLNLGHTFGHALEAWAGYSDRLLHGEAVAIGMRMAFAFSEELELCPTGTTDRVETHLTAVGLPTRIADIPGHTQDRPTLERLTTLMAQDKKVQAGQLTFILARDIGDTFVTRDVKTDELQAFLSRQIS